MLHTECGEDDQTVYLDACLLGSDIISKLFSFTRTYFMVDASIPSQYVLFLQQLMPRKAVSEIYSCLGHHRHGKTYYFRTATRHMRSTEDAFIPAPGIKGMVMAVFTLEPYEYVFKIIKDRFTPPKEVTHQEVRDKYQLVKRWDRAGRMADTQEFANLVFEASRFSEELMEELRQTCSSQLKVNGRALIIKHCYVERRMQPLNLYLKDATDEEVDAVMLDYGNAIKELAAANISGFSFQAMRVREKHLISFTMTFTTLYFGSTFKTSCATASWKIFSPIRIRCVSSSKRPDYGKSSHYSTRAGVFRRGQLRSVVRPRTTSGGSYGRVPQSEWRAIKCGVQW